MAAKKQPPAQAMPRPDQGKNNSGDALGTAQERAKRLAEALPTAIQRQEEAAPGPAKACRERQSSEQLAGPRLLDFIERNYSIEWNQLKQRPIVNGLMPSGREKRLFYLDISNLFPGVKAKKDEAQDALDYIALQNSFNPIERYVENLKERASRGELQLLKLDEIAVKGFGVADDDWLSKTLLARKLVQQLKRGLHYGFKADEMLILQGGQGTYKTEAIKALAPQTDWVCTETDLGDTKDWKFLLKISQSWIFLFDECDKFLRGKDSATLKSIISNTHDSYAAKGLNEVDEHPRPSTMWGTTNESSLFNDHTGVRRWWLVRVGHGRRCDPGWIQRNRDSIWATAYTWAMWGLESYLPRGSDEAEAAKARAWSATYSLDDDGAYLQRLSAIPIDGRTDLPLPIAKSDLIRDISEIDTKRLWQTDRKRARDLQADVTRIVTASNARSHDWQIRWDERKGRVPGHPNPVRAFYPVRVAEEAERQPAAAEFQGDPIPRVSIPVDAVPIVRHGQTHWQEGVLTSLFQCVDKKKKSIDQERDPGPNPGGCAGGEPYPEKVGTSEQEPEKLVPARRLPVPNLGVLKTHLSEQAGDPQTEVGIAAVLADQELAKPTPDRAEEAAIVVQVDRAPRLPSPVELQDLEQALAQAWRREKVKWAAAGSLVDPEAAGSEKAPDEVLARHANHIKQKPTRVTLQPFNNNLAAFLDGSQEGYLEENDPVLEQLLDQQALAQAIAEFEVSFKAAPERHPVDSYAFSKSDPSQREPFAVSQAAALPVAGVAQCQQREPSTPDLQAWFKALPTYKQVSLKLHLRHPGKPSAALINSVFVEEQATPIEFAGAQLKAFLESPEATAWLAANKHSDHCQEVA